MTSCRKFAATYKQWGNLYRGRFYIDGTRVPEWQFDALFNTHVSKSGASYTREYENIPQGYRITHKII